MADLHPLLAAVSTTVAIDPFDAVKAAHLLNRAGFGGTPEEIEQGAGAGPERAVDWLLDFPDARRRGAEPDGCARSVGDRRVSDKLSARLHSCYAGKTDEERKALRQKLMAANREAVMATVDWWMKRMAYGPHPLQEKLTLFWHGHFTTSAKDERGAIADVEAERIAADDTRPGISGSSCGRSAAIRRCSITSTTRRTAKQHPNENYARELMELFTLGIGNYTEDDVKQGARAFTGWAHDGDDFVFRKFDHDDGIKTFLGRSGNFNGDDIIDIILSQPACAAIHRRRSCSDFSRTKNWTMRWPKRWAASFATSKYELRPLLRTILTSKAFYSRQAIGSQIKSPVQLVRRDGAAAGI